jgi:hypothetical protein
MLIMVMFYHDISMGKTGHNIALAQRAVTVAIAHTISIATTHNQTPSPTPHKSNTIETLKTTIATPNYKMLNWRDRTAPSLW